MNNYLIIGSTILSTISLGLCIYFYLSFKDIKSTLKQLTHGLDFDNFEDLVNKYIAKADKNKDNIKNIDEKLTKFISYSDRNIQKVGFKRYNPFHETGGDQSFILVLLDKKNNGLIISSLHQRDVTRVYGKLVESGECKQKLSDEEKELLNNTL